MAQTEQTTSEADSLYRRFGQPLEREHLGQYVAIASDGRTVLGPTILDVMRKASVAFGPGNFIFKVGQRAVGKWR